MGLAVDHGIGNVSVEAGQGFTFVIPNDAFLTDTAGSRLTYQASLANGLSLPYWLHFDPKTGTFSGVAPEGEAGDLHIQVKAVDGKGHQAVTTFIIKSGVAAKGNAESSPGPRASAPLSGKELLSILGVPVFRLAPDVDLLHEASTDQPAEQKDLGDGAASRSVAQGEQHALRLSAQLLAETQRFSRAREATLRHLEALEQAG
jgi:hypothetical protein